MWIGTLISQKKSDDVLWFKWVYDQWVEKNPSSLRIIFHIIQAFTRQLSFWHTQLLLKNMSYDPYFLLSNYIFKIFKFWILDPSYIYSCFLSHIWEHEFCHLGCWAVKEKILKRWNFCLSKQLFEVVFSCFEGQKFNFRFFFYFIASALKSCLIRNNFFFEKLNFWPSKHEKIGYHSRFFGRKSWV